jgi:hypothetical protein
VLHYVREEDKAVVAAILCQAQDLQVHSFLRHGAHLLADNAWDLMCPGQAPVAIDGSQTDYRQTLLSQLKRWDSA